MNLSEALSGARNEIIGGIVVLAITILLGWVYKRYRTLKKVYTQTKQEIERMKEETSRIGATKEEHGRLMAEIQRKDEALRHAEEKSREDSLRIEKLCRQIDNLQEELQRKIEALSQVETQSQEDSRFIAALQSELQHKSEALEQAEAKSQEASRRIEALQQELEREKAKKRLPPISDSDFLELCKFGYVREVEEAIMNGANVNAKDAYGNTALFWAKQYGRPKIIDLLRSYGAK